MYKGPGVGRNWVCLKNNEEGSRDGAGEEGASGTAGGWEQILLEDDGATGTI